MRLPAAILAALLLAAPPASAAPGGNFQVAAESWLALVDQQRYGESWNAASRLFRARVGQAAWERQVDDARAPLGALDTRTIESDTRATSLPGAPDGEYEVLRYRSRFTRKAVGIETVTLVREAGGWKVAGYFIR